MSIQREMSGTVRLVLGLASVVLLGVAWVVWRLGPRSDAFASARPLLASMCVLFGAALGILAYVGLNPMRRPDQTEDVRLLIALGRATADQRELLERREAEFADLRRRYDGDRSARKLLTIIVRERIAAVDRVEERLGFWQEKDPGALAHLSSLREEQKARRAEFEMLAAQLA